MTVFQCSVVDINPITGDKRSDIASTPNNPDDQEYIIRLVGQVIRVSVETLKIVTGLPREYSYKTKKEV